MNLEQLVGRWIPSLIGLADFFERLKVQYPDLAPELDPKIAALRQSADPALLGSAVGAGLSELQRMFETMSLDPRFKSQDLA